MTGRSRYTAAALAFVISSVAVAWPLIGPEARTSMAVVGLLAVAVQAPLFVLLSGAHGDPSRFMASWGIGMAARFGFVALVGAAVTVGGIGEPRAAVLSAVGFVLVLHLLETAFLRSPVPNPGGTEVPR